jgi:NAD(P)-dependent dehydrogenase (short-subunit alcohol dehydrogenase family)
LSDPQAEVDPTESAYLDACRRDGKVALITGAGSERGIGREIGLTYAAAGAAVGLADVDEDGVQAAARAVQANGGEAVPLRMDVTNPGSVSAAATAFERELGPVDILVNSAGISRSTPIWEISLKEFDRIMGINVRGGFLYLKAVLPGMMRRRHGRVVWLSSVAGKQGGGIFGTSHYAASKAAVIGLCQAAARALGPYGITSNAIAPGFVDTGIVARSSSREIEDQVRVSVAGSAPLRRVATAKEIACAALYPSLRTPQPTSPARSLM